MIDDNPRSQTHNSWHCCDLQPQGPRSRAFYYSRNSLLHTWITYYTELPMKVHRLENPYNAPPPIAITGNRLTPGRGRDPSARVRGSRRGKGGMPFPPTEAVDSPSYCATTLRHCRSSKNTKGNAMILTRQCFMKIIFGIGGRMA